MNVWNTRAARIFLPFNLSSAVQKLCMFHTMYIHIHVPELLPNNNLTNKLFRLCHRDLWIWIAHCVVSENIILVRTQKQTFLTLSRSGSGHFFTFCWGQGRDADKVIESHGIIFKQTIKKVIQVQTLPQAESLIKLMQQMKNIKEN